MISMCTALLYCMISTFIKPDKLYSSESTVNYLAYNQNNFSYGYRGFEVAWNFENSCLRGFDMNKRTPWKKYCKQQNC